MKIPLFFRWVWHCIVSAWNAQDEDTQGCLVLCWFVVSVMDVILLIWVISTWTREVGYGGLQLIYNVTANVFWCTGLPLSLIILYGIYKGLRWVWSSSIKSYKQFKQDNS